MMLSAGATPGSSLGGEATRSIAQGLLLVWAEWSLREGLGGNHLGRAWTWLCHIPPLRMPSAFIAPHSGFVFGASEVVRSYLLSLLRDHTWRDWGILGARDQPLWPLARQVPCAGPGISYCASPVKQKPVSGGWGGGWYSRRSSRLAHS